VPRKPRFFLPEVPVHAFQRGHNKQPVFFEDQDYLAYLRFLKSTSDTLGCLIHAYVLMTNHVHLLVTPEAASDIGSLFQGIGRHFVPYINKTYHRRGGLWEGRYKSNLMDAEDYFLICMRYIEMNPVRAGMVSHPEKYRWSSYATNALGIDNAIVKPHPLYLALGNNAATRLTAYQELFAQAIPEQGLELIRTSLHSGTPLGGDCFKAQIEAALGRSVGYGKRGRPNKVEA
jgi:putative transposase